MKVKYRTVIIDPPWLHKTCNVGTIKTIGVKKDMPYSSMTDEEILNFPINNFAADECDLFLWVTHTKLPQALKCLKFWGFKYHIMLTWNKLSGICLNGFFRKTELLLYGYRGKMGISRKKGKYIPTMFQEKVKRHSEKPAVIYDIIRKRSASPRIDLFARKKHPGFDSWGDEVDQNQVTLKNYQNRDKKQ